MEGKMKPDGRRDGISYPTCVTACRKSSIALGYEPGKKSRSRFLTKSGATSGRTGAGKISAEEAMHLINGESNPCSSKPSK